MIFRPCLPAGRFRDAESGGRGTVNEPYPAGGGGGPSQEAVQEQAVLDVVLGWLALYLPSWGTSVVLHVAVIILAAFLAWQSQAVQPPFEYKLAVVPRAATPKTEVRPTAPRDTLAKLEPQELSVVRKPTTNPFPGGVSSDLKPLEVIGLPDGSGRGGPGGGGPLPWGRGGLDIFPPVPGAKKVVYVVDRSGSMTDSIDYVKYELKRSISELTEDKEFHVVFYSSGPPVEMPTRRLVNATERNKQLAFEFIDGVVPQGETDPSKALERAFACNPELIYLLTDGEFDKTIVGLVKRLNARGEAAVSTILFVYRPPEAERMLKQIAEENRGEYKFVSPEDLAALVP